MFNSEPGNRTLKEDHSDENNMLERLTCLVALPLLALSDASQTRFEPSCMSLLVARVYQRMSNSTWQHPRMAGI